MEHDGRQPADQRIRELAYRLWEEEGRPEGRAEAHWEMASRRLAGAPDDPGTGAPARAPTEKDPRPRRGGR